MRHPDDSELVDAALAGTSPGDPSDAERVTLAHVAGCDRCRATVDDVRRVADLLRDTTAEDARWLPSPDTVWAAVAARLDSPASGGVGGDPEPGLPPATRPTSPTPPTPTRTQPDELAARRERTRSPRLVGWAAGIAAAGLVIGLLTGRALWREPAQTAPTTVAQVTLDTLDTRQRGGDASVVRTRTGVDLTVDTTTPLDAGDGYLEVWLINRDLKRMVSVGVLRGEGTASFPITQSLIDQGYTVVDISKEHFDDQPAHSGDSLLRGSLPA
ncbi:anti-sigma factor [Terracoccus luteus]|uniref:Anti-sigma K factor RskA C-terminal domain-containing protein n=1 Tax=Terracoccus luteus TaxID=53356 RepID=A0A839PW99_9MICO|nr:anti-sigma factor [Terracoccus luteus]MBB2986266.1 hypothetical protein [Terracoccus luteus]MCP2172144.1 hypothetical protein [Terracoccus luteus]